MMYLKQLNYFLHVAQTLNMTQSANQLHVAQPSISRSIHDLEAEIGVPLFIRQGHHLRLTNQGHYFYQEVHRSLALLNEGKQNVQHLYDESENVLTFKFQEDTPLLVEFYRLLKQALPQVKLNFVQTPKIEDDRHYDFHLVSRPIPGQINVLLINEEIMLAGKQALPTWKGKYLTIDSLNNLPMIFFRSSPFQSELNQWLTQHELQPQVIFQTGDRRLTAELASDGLAYFLFPTQSWASVIDQHKLQLFHLESNGLHRKIYLSYPQGPRTKLQKQAFNLLIKHFT